MKEMLDLLEEEKRTVIDRHQLDYKQTLNAKDGTVVALITEEEGERITVSSNKGQIIFEYHPETKKCHLYVPEGDLHFNAPAGSVNISSGHDIKLQCPGDIVIEGENNVKLYSGTPSIKNAALNLGCQRVKLSGEKIEIQAGEGDFSIIKTRWRSRRLAAKIDRARFNFTYLDVLAETMRQSATNLFQNIEDLFQVNAGRMRMFVYGLFNLRGKRTYLKAEKDMKLKGEKIHLR